LTNIIVYAIITLENEREVTTMTEYEYEMITTWTPDEEDLFLPPEQASALYESFLAYVEEFPAES
jgi:hypothetical protein